MLSRKKCTGGSKGRDPGSLSLEDVFRPVPSSHGRGIPVVRQIQIGRGRHAKSLFDGMRCGAWRRKDLDQIGLRWMVSSTLAERFPMLRLFPRQPRLHLLWH